MMSPVAPDAEPNATSSQTTPPGLLIVITGASGVGKGTLREGWLRGQNVFYSVSWTTREARPGEQDGRDYFFKTKEEFLQRAAQDGFLEHAEFVGNHYGTPAAPIEEALKRGQDAILEIEVEGAMQVKRRLGQRAILIFIVPPSLSELEKRLTGRATETPERIKKRLARARDEIREAHEFRYVVVNDDLGKAVNELLTIQQAERIRQRPETTWTTQEQATVRAADALRSERWTPEQLAQIIHS